jgi:DegV family protein with EDD domain
MKIITADREFIDNESANVGEMTEYLKNYKGKSGSSCPNVGDWLDSFEDYDNIFCVTITSGLSGSYNSAKSAAEEYVASHPDRHVWVCDTLSVGPEAVLIIEKMRELILDGHDFDGIVEEIKKYQKKTHLIFALESLRNLANNGRVSPLVAKISGVLGIRVVGKASNEGTLEVTNKARGGTKALSSIVENMLSSGYIGGKLRIHHCANPNAAESLKKEILSLYPRADISIIKTRILCSFYAEQGGLLVGFEG